MNIRTQLTTVFSSAAVLGMSVAAIAQPKPKLSPAPTREQAPNKQISPGPQLDYDDALRPGPDSYSVALVRAAAERKALRRELDFANMPLQMQAAMWQELVGPDQLDNGHGVAMQRPIPDQNGDFEEREGGPFTERDLLVDLSWVYTPTASAADSFVWDMCLNVDGDVVLAGENHPPGGGEELKAIEVKGVVDAASATWEVNWIKRYVAGADSLAARDVASDLQGNSFFGGTRGDGRYHVRQLNGVDGTVIRQVSFFPEGSGSVTTNAGVTDICVDPEGIVFVAGYYSADCVGCSRKFVARLNPNNNLNQDWIVTSPRSGPTQNWYMAPDRRGGIVVAATTASGNVEVTKYDAIDGYVEWTWVGPVISGGPRALKLDYDGNAYVLHAPNSGGSQVVKLDEKTGAAIYTRNESALTVVDIALDQDRNVFCAASSAGVASLIKLDANGVRASGYTVPTYGTTMSATRVALDYLGNPYILGTYGASGSGAIKYLSLRKYNPVTGALVWVQENITPLPTSGSTEINVHLTPNSLVVDAGGSIYIGGYRGIAPAGGGQVLDEFFCVRYEQPFVSIPQIATSSVDVRVEDYSVWSPQNRDPLAGFNNTFQIFNIDVDNLGAIVTGKPLDNYVTDTMTRELDYVLGTVKGQVNLDMSSNVNLGVNFVTAASGGSYDATVKGDLSVAVPGEAELFAGQGVPISLEFRPDANGMEMIANSTPELSATFVSNATGTFDLDVFAWNKNFVPDYPPPFVDVDVLPPPSFPDNDIPFQFSSLDNKTILSVFGANPPAPGTWYDYEVGPVSGSFIMPNLKAQAAFSTLSVSGGNANNDNDDDYLRLQSAISEEFFNAGVSITDTIAQAAGFPPLSFGWSLPGGDEDTNISLDVGLLQATLNGDIKIEQDLTMDMKPYIRLELSNGQSIERTLVKRDTSTGVAFEPEDPINGNEVLLPVNGLLEITPYFGVRGKMNNTTGFRFGASAGFDPLALETQFTAVGVNIFSLDECFLCQSIPIVNTRFNVFNNTSPWFKFTGDAANTEVQLPTIVLKGDANLTPQLIGTSRANARMIIYNQRDATPTAAELAAVAGGTEPMIIYGRKFFSGTHPKGYIAHQGRTFAMDTTRLNDQALLVQVPKRFYLLPGIARMWVQNDNGKTASTSFAIEYPLPNFLGIQGLDGATNPEIWAGDPRWMNSPVVAIDGLTPAGNDSFITRRDYYTRLANMWSSSLFQVGEQNAGLSGPQYFPAFKGWQSDIPPGFPSLIFDGTALARKRPVINDGYFRSVLPMAKIDIPRLQSDLILSNPGPGGGPSRTRSVTIPAPKPVIATLSPNTFAPGTLTTGSTLRVVVTGPASVPYFTGYESVKAGNFTRESTVYVNGTAVTTTFTNSGMLTAEVPASMLTTVGPRFFTVVTPGNNTTYFEELRNGSGTVVSSGQVASGGVSLPATFNVLWPTPEISALSTTSLQVGVAPDTPTPADGSPADGHNFGITGANFAPGCTAYWNGRALLTTRVDAGGLRVTVSAQEVATIGTARIWVTNPQPNLRSSIPMDILITP